MGREWCRNIRRTSTKRGHRDGSGGRDVDGPSGCMTSVLQLLDFYPFHFCLQPHRGSLITNSVFPREPPKEAAGKNIQTMEIEAAPLSPILVEDLQQGLQANPMRIQTNTRRDTALKVVPSSSSAAAAATTRTRDADLSSENGSSPGPKTPNLVARLMGLDLIPESPAPTIHSGEASTPQRKSMLLQQTRKGRVSNCGGTRSLPESPRTSAGRRSDVHPRLSLQINRENNNSFCDELGGRCYVIKPTGDETRSPGGDARQTVKQVKENVLSRRGFGVDITNTAREKKRGDEPVAIGIQVKSKKSDKATSTKCVVEERSPRPSMPTPATVSPAKYRTPHVSHVRRATFGEDQSYSPIKYDWSTPPRSQPQRRALQKQRRKAAGTKWEKAAGQRLRSVRQKRSPEEPSLRAPASTAEATPICNELISKKSSTPPLQLQPPRRRSQWPAKYPSQPAGAESEYNSTVLKQAGSIRTETKVSISTILSPTLSQHPSIFELLEESSSIIADARAQPKCCRRSSQRLLFSLVEELLKPVNSSVAVRRRCSAFVSGGFCGHQALDALCRKLRSFPSADCKAMEDIDALVEGELTLRSKAPQSPEGREVDEIVEEVQRQIMDALVRETVVVFGGLFPVRRLPPCRPGHSVTWAFQVSRSAMPHRTQPAFVQ